MVPRSPVRPSPGRTTVRGGLGCRSSRKRADVTRLTVYRHFPDEEALYLACSAHWLAQQVLPDPDAWAQLADPAERLRAGLADLYRYYRQGAAMLTRAYRDKQAMPGQLQQLADRTERHHRDVLLEPFAGTRAQRRRLRAVLGHAVSFWTWRSLCLEGGCRTARPSMPWPPWPWPPQPDQHPHPCRTRLSCRYYRDRFCRYAR
jgi:AcrR family transcriptional regulator